MESTAARKQRLAMGIKALREWRKIDTQQELADRTGSGPTGVSKRTIAGIESAERTPNQTTLNKLDVAFDIPVGSLQSLFDGKISDIHDITGDAGSAAGDDAMYEVGGQVYTHAEIKVLAKALGPKGLYDWATGSLTSDNSPSQGAI